MLFSFVKFLYLLFFKALLKVKNKERDFFKNLPPSWFLYAVFFLLRCYIPLPVPIPMPFIC